MKKNLLDGFFWRDPYTGKRRPRDIFWGVMLALLAVVIAVVAAVVFKPYYSAALPPTPTLRPPTATPLPSPTFTPSPVPTATPVPKTEKEKMLAEIRGCDPDPANWKMVKIFGNWYRITEPSCALTALGRAVAWHIATRAMGYTADEAAQALGYPKGKWPWAPSRTGWVIFKTAGREGYAPIRYIFYPDMRQWKVSNKTGEQGNIVLTPRGCYRGTIEEKGRPVPWRDKGFPFDVECFFYEDFMSEASVFDWGEGIVGDEPDTPSRVSVLFAYAPETGWVYLGRISDKRFAWAIPDWEKQHHNVSVMDDEKHYAEMWGIPLWDVKWVQKAWEMPVKPLPKEWNFGMGKSKKFHDFMLQQKQRLDQWIQENALYGVEPPQ